MFNSLLDSFKWLRASHIILVIWMIAIFNNAYWKQHEDIYANKQVLNNDILWYYQYLPAFFVFNDPSFKFNEKRQENFNGIVYVAEDNPGSGKYGKMTMGLSFLYAPFFIAGHITAKISGYTADGYSKPYVFFMSFSGMFYAFLGLLLLEKTLRRYYSSLVAALTILTVALATNLYYYVVYDGPLSHAHNFFLISLFIFLMLRWYEKPTLITSIQLGFVYGLIALVRPSNAVVIILPMLYGVTNFRSLTDKHKLIAAQYPKLLVATLFAFIAVLPQLIFWKMNTGHWFVYSYRHEKFYFTNPHIIEGLFSYRNGWLVYTPVMLLAIAGFFLLKKYANELKWGIIIFFFVNIYIIFSWWCWWYVGYSIRPMIDCYAILCIPMAALIQQVLKLKYIKVLVYPVLGFFIYLGLFQTIQHKKQHIHYDSGSRAAYWAAFMKKDPPSNYWDLLKKPDYETAVAGKEEAVKAECFP